MTFQSINPFSEEIIAVHEATNQSEIQKRLLRSQSGFGVWRKMKLPQRLVFLENLALLIEKNLDTLSIEMVEEMGKTLTEARAEVGKCVQGIRFFIEKSPAWLAPKTVASDAIQSQVLLQPLGGILLVMPWNFPLWQVLRAAVPALCAGNVVLLKHAPNVFRYARRIENLFSQARFPEGVFENFLVGIEELEGMLASDAVAAVSLTGSEKAGRSMASLAGKYLKKCVLELGGSDPFIVLPDADLPLAASLAAKARLINNGQSCIAAKRFLVHRSIHHVFLDLFSAEMAQFKPGNPQETNCLLGPQARKDLLQNLENQLDKSLSQGARLHFQMKEKVESGFFFQPVVLSEVKPGMACFEEEVFGPIAAVTSFSDVEEAIVLANQTRFGLGASIYSRNIQKAEKIAHELDCGTVTINSMVRSKPGLPFGGIKASGYGRELSEFGLQEFCNLKAVSVG
jgi:succinate-semialdehyde dehydrogenase/glutarate-semialdehyde dehydrogenase